MSTNDDKHRANDASLRRLVAADWWRWMPGMLVRDLNDEAAVLRVAEVVPSHEDSPAGLVASGDAGTWCYDASGYLPLPSDPATAGCLLAMFLRGSNPDLALMGLSAARPGPDAYASFGDFLVAELLAGECDGQV